MIRADPLDRLTERLPHHAPDGSPRGHSPVVFDPVLAYFVETADDCGYPIRVRTAQECEVPGCPRWWLETFEWCGCLPMIEHLHTGHHWCCRGRR